MTETSRAAVLFGRGELEIQEFPLPDVRDDDGLLRIEATGVCGTDVAAYDGNAPFYELPCVLGHELVGRVERIGEFAAQRWGVSQGDRVVVEEYLPCGTCRSCLAGAYQMCWVKRYGGKSIHAAPALYGGYADYMYLHPQAIVHRADDTTPPELLQLYIPISNGLHWVQEVGGVRSGQTVVIIGPGPHGLGCVVGAREAGAGLIVLVGQEHDRTRLEVGRALGADHALSGSPEETIAAVAELTGGLLAECVVNAADSAGPLELAFALAGDRSTIVQVGLAHGSGTTGLDAIAEPLLMRRITLRGVIGRPSSAVGPALRLIESGRYPLEKLNTGTFTVPQTEAVLADTARDREAIRSVIVPAAA
jgi:threonine dehydrogenase-like Zn-dependent dehydrogenase